MLVAQPVEAAAGVRLMDWSLILASFLFGLMTRLGVSERRMWKFLGLEE